MTSLPSNVTLNSWTSSNVRNILEIYRDSQQVPLDPTLSPNDDCEAYGSTSEEEADTFDSENRADVFDDTLKWSQGNSKSMQAHRRNQDFGRPEAPFNPTLQEVVPLLHRAASFSGSPSPYYSSVASASNHEQVVTSTLRHEISGNSTFGQTLFNAIASLLGIGMLSEPLAFAYAGWTCGTAILISYGLLACYTAKILASFIAADPSLRTYADIGRKAFGTKSITIVNFFFCMELFTVSVVFVTLYADSLEAVLPAYSANTYKIIGLAIFLPTAFLPLSVLSISSLVGIISSVALVAVILIDGFFKIEAPGSLWQPAPTSFAIESYSKLGISFGLFMAGFAGHAVIPTLARDMKNPSEFNKMIDIAFIVSTFIYMIIGFAGYRMFGGDVSEEFSQDLLSTPGYNKELNRFLLWLLVLLPLTKFGLVSRPLTATFEAILGLDNPPQNIPQEHAGSTTSITRQRNATFRKAGIVAERTLATVAAVGVSILVPNFSAVMGFLGSFSAFMLCIIGPMCAKVAIDRYYGKMDAILLVMAVFMAACGTFSVWYSG